MIITPDNQCSFPYTPANSQQVNSLIELLKNSDIDSKEVLSKMTKAASSAMAQNHCQQITNQELMRAECHRVERAQQKKGNFKNTRVMNLGILQERENKEAAKNKEKADDRLEKEWIKSIKEFDIYKPDIFAPRKEKVSKQATAKASKRGAGKASERGAGKVSEHGAGHVSEQATATAKASEHGAGQASERGAGKASEHGAGHASEQATAKASEPEARITRSGRAIKAPRRV